jgi:hypothetical protein
MALVLGTMIADLLQESYGARVGMEVPQPVPFSHEHHVEGLGIDCRFCHTSVEKSPFAGMPSTETCMKCHQEIWKDSPVLAPVRESYRTGKPLAWNRVHNLPDFVYFDHSVHVQKGIPCQVCHGNVDQMPLVRKENTLYMRWCFDCHRHPGNYVAAHYHPGRAITANDLSFGKPKVGTAEKWDPHLDPSRIKQIQDCSACHR